MKHADHAPEKSIDLDEADVDVALHLACHDFGRVTGSMPIEAQVFEAWSSARGVRRVSDRPLRGQQLLRRAIRHSLASDRPRLPSNAGSDGRRWPKH